MLNSYYLYFGTAIIAALLIAAFQYLYKNKNKSRLKFILFSLRFLSVLSLLVLLINPKINKTEVEIVKPSLVVLTDNSKSISNLKQDSIVVNILKKIKLNKELNNKFKLDYYVFSDDISFTDSLNFKKDNTNIYKSLQSVAKLYTKNVAPLLLITDGNQTYGNDYSNIKLKQSVYPIVVGDTTVYQDIYISQLNVNKYAYLKNKFPVEVFINYKGVNAITSKLTVSNGKTVVFSKKIQLNAANNAKKVDFFLNATSVGFKNYKVRLSALPNEKNNYNNTKNFTIEVLNQQSKIIIISDILHPDIAMFKRVIETNKQREVILSKPKKTLKLTDYQLVILYQPTINFKPIFTAIEKENKNVFIITGSKTNWNFLNSSQNFFKKKSIKNTESYLPLYNTAYSTFLTKNIGFENFQPLTDVFGKVSFSVPYQSILFQQIGNVSSAEPLFITFEQNNRRGAVLLGENSWRWRMTSKIETNSFEAFDTFFNKTIQYLASNKKASYLDVSSKPYYYQNEPIKINAKFYDANYVFDPNAKLWITVTNKQTKKQHKYPFALLNNNYEVNFSKLEKGNYSFVVSNKNDNSTAYGHFTILDYNLEQQFDSANKKSLEQLATLSNTKIHFNNNIQNLFNKLIEDEKYVSIQKSKEITTPLIDWEWLLGLIVLLLSVEWFIRKYKGYI